LLLFSFLFFFFKRKREKKKVKYYDIKIENCYKVDL